MAVPGHGLQEVPLLGREWGAEVLRKEEIGEPDDAVEGCPQLVGNVRQELILRLHRPVELGVELLQPLRRLADFDGQAPGVVMGCAALAGDREVGSRLVECRALVDAERSTRDDLQDADELGACAQRHEHQALRHRRGQTELVTDRLRGLAVIVHCLRRVPHQIAHGGAGDGAGFHAAGDAGRPFV